MAIIQAPTGCCNLVCLNSYSTRFRNGTSSLSINTTPRKIPTLSCSLLDDGVTGNTQLNYLCTPTVRPKSLHTGFHKGSAVQALEIDPTLAVKKKAMEISPGLKGTSLYLVGINSTMKTRLGKLLADTLRYYYFDSDNLVVEAAGGEAAAKQFLNTDKTGFRESETEVLRQLSSMGRLVVSAGDGAVQSSTNLSLLRHGISIWVDVPLDIVAKEIVENGVQLFGTEISPSTSHSEVLSQITIIYEELQRGYAIADATISLQKVAGLLGYDDVEDVSTENMALEVLSELEKLIRVKKMMEEAARPF